MGGRVTDDEIAGKLFCFGADGVSTFQGLKSGVTTQIKDKFAPFSTGVHCCAHRLNLAAQSLSSLTVMHTIEEDSPHDTCILRAFSEEGSQI